MEVTRTIHPVGQGAFYSEVLRCTKSNRTFTVVYDCGSTNARVCPPILSDYLATCELVEKCKVIDILFISHFHCDHINGIKALIEAGVKIRNVVMPYIKPQILKDLESFEALTSGSEGSSLDFHFQNPYTILHSMPACSETRFLYVVDDPAINGPFLPHDSQSVNPFEGKGDIVDLSSNVQTEKGRICYWHSGDVFRVCDWFFLPFVDSRRAGDAQFEEAINDLKNLIDDLQKRHGNDWLIIGKDQIRDAYKKISTNLNQTSLMLFSSPVNNEQITGYEVNHECLGYYTSYYKIWPSCLYTGDISLTNSVCLQIGKKLGQYKIGTLQLPHHGAKNGWIVGITVINNKIKGSTNFYSHGLSNIYHHPHKEVYMAFRNNKEIFHGVNEANNSILIQTISI